MCWSRADNSRGHCRSKAAGARAVGLSSKNKHLTVGLIPDSAVNFACVRRRTTRVELFQVLLSWAIVGVEHGVGLGVGVLVDVGVALDVVVAVGV